MRACVVMMAVLVVLTPIASGAEAQAVGRRQAAARARMQEVERRLVELADLLEPQDPLRAEALRRALALSREQFIVSNMAQVEAHLQSGNYGAAVQVEEQVLAALGRLRDLLAANADVLALEALVAAEARLADLVQRQAQALARTRVAEPLEAEAGAQRAIRSDLHELVGDLRGAGATKWMADAERLMEEAEGALSGGRRAEATQAQAGAQARLEDARAALRAAIGRRRRAEQARTREVLLEALRNMLDEQRAIRGTTEELHAAGIAGRAYRLRALALAEREGGLLRAAESVLETLAEDGTTVALPAALQQARDDMAECARLLGEARTGPEVTALQEGIEATLEALIEALRTSVPEATEKPETAEEQEAGSGEDERPLVGIIGQLKVLRALQLTLNAQTARPGADAARLAERQGVLAEAAGALAADVPPLAPVASTMQEAQRMLEQGRTGHDARVLQERAVSQLDALIRRLEELAPSAETTPGEPGEAVAGLAPRPPARIGSGDRRLGPRAAADRAAEDRRHLQDGAVACTVHGTPPGV